jgi:type IV pilus assembly protein PilA
MPSTLLKAFIYGFVVAIANFIPYIEKAIAETPKTISGQAAIAGTWKLTPPKPPLKPQVYNLTPVPPLKIIITKEGKIYMQDPLDLGEYTEVGVIQKTSEDASLPANAKINSPYPSPNRSRQSEAKAYTGSMNRAQQAHFVERASWSKNIQDLGIDIKPENENYRYSIKIDSAIATLKIKPYPGIAINMAIAKQPDLKSYVGIVYVQHGPNSNDIDDITSWVILCQSNQPTMKTPSQPTWNGKQIICPDGYTAIDR